VHRPDPDVVEFIFVIIVVIVPCSTSSKSSQSKKHKNSVSLVFESPLPLSTILPRYLSKAWWKWPLCRQIRVTLCLFNQLPIIFRYHQQHAVSNLDTICQVFAKISKLTKDARLLGEELRIKTVAGTTTDN